MQQFDEATDGAEGPLDANRELDLTAAAGLAIETGVRLTRLVRRTVREHPRPTLSLSRLRALAFLVDNPAVCLSDLAEHLLVGVPTASKLVDDLADRGLLSRSPDAADRRRLALRVTEDGERILATAARPARDRIARLLERLAPADRKQVVDGLSLLRPLLDPRSDPLDE